MAVQCPQRFVPMDYDLPRRHYSPLFDMTLVHAGKRLFKVHINHPEVGRDLWSRLRKVVERIEELDCWFGTPDIFSFLSSLGSAQNMKVFRLRNGADGARANYWRGRQHVELPAIFRGGLPSLREVGLTTTVTWAPGLFRGLRSFEFGAGPRIPFSPTHFLDVLRESPMIESVRLIGDCPRLNKKPPVVALLSLKDCALIGDGATYLIWYLDIPASANVFLSGPPPLGSEMELHQFQDLYRAPNLHILDRVSVVSFSIGFDTFKFWAQNESGGSLDLQVYSCGDPMTGLLPLYHFLARAFSDGVRGFKTAKEFVLHIERGVGRDDQKAVSNSVILTGFTSGAPGLERIKLYGVPATALSLHLGHLCENRDAAVPFPDLQRLHVETTPIHSPKSLLEDLDRLLKRRQDLGVPLQSVYVKVNCERLIPMTEHSAFLTAWEGLVGEDVEVEYSRDKVELPSWGQLMNSLDEDSEEEGGEDEEGGEEDEEVGVAEDAGDGDLEWESWISGRWPKAVSELRKQTGRDDHRATPVHRHH